MDGCIVIAIAHIPEPPVAKSDVKLVMKDGSEILLPITIAKYDREAVLKHLTYFLDVLDKELVNDVRVPTP